jgi:peptide/nickel transport system substrate-binding protein
MDRRTFLKSAVGLGALATAGGLATPAISQRAAARTLRLVPHADLANTLTPRRQMVEAEEVSADGLTWTFRLRPGLKFHDGEPVLAKDAVASINRWAAREPVGQMIKAIENELVAIDDRTFRWALKRPFPKMLLALGKLGAPCCFVMPARIAATDPFRQIGEYVGSGPMRFLRNEWISGAKAVFEKFADYVPRQEPASWLAGGKNIVVNRIEWIILNPVVDVLFFAKSLSHKQERECLRAPNRNCSAVG